MTGTGLLVASLVCWVLLVELRLWAHGHALQSVERELLHQWQTWCGIVKGRSDEK